MSKAYAAIRQRKLIYLVAIVLLLFAAFVHKFKVIDEQAKKYDISETNLGKVDLGGSISRFVLSSFRGPLVCGLWWEVEELQQRHDFKQLELLVTALTKLQPHYKGPWKYQGWNLAYNVSVEFERAEDKYFYISKGIRWLAYGEEINRLRLYDETRPDKVRIVGDPELRSQFAQDLSNKMYYADENQLYRPLLHMSCIPPSQRKPIDLKNNADQMKRFKDQYPRFVRRVRTYLNIPEGDEKTLDRELVQFLTQFKDVPSLWKMDENNNAVLSDDPWPRWPNMADKEFIGKVADQELLQDSLDISRRWYAFSTEMLPEPKRDLTDDVTPIQDRFTRTNKSMHSMIFRAKPAQTQSRSATELYKEGWPTLAQTIASDAHAMWVELGRYTNILPPEQELQMHLTKANNYTTKYKEKADLLEMPPEYLKVQNPTEYASALDDYKSFIFVSNFSKLRSMCRYDYWLASMELAKSDIFRDAYHHRYLAEHRYTDWPVSMNNYQKAFGLYEIMLKQQLSQPEMMSLHLSVLAPGTVLSQLHPGTSSTPTTYANIDTVQEDLIEFQQRYLRTYARSVAPDRLKLEMKTWEGKQLLAQAMATLSPTSSVLACLSPIVGTKSLDIDWIEEMLENQTAPFDSIIPEQIRQSKEKDKAIMKK
jgi:hypothetical protein